MADHLDADASPDVEEDASDAAELAAMRRIHEETRRAREAREAAARAAHALDEAATAELAQGFASPRPAEDVEARGLGLFTPLTPVGTPGAARTPGGSGSGAGLFTPTAGASPAAPSAAHGALTAADVRAMVQAAREEAAAAADRVARTGLPTAPVSASSSAAETNTALSTTGAAAEEAAAEAEEAALARQERERRLQREREQVLLQALQEVLAGDMEKFAQFKHASSSFRHSRISGPEYYDTVQLIVGDESVMRILPLACAAIPDEGKRHELEHVLREAERIRARRRAEGVAATTAHHTASTEPMRIIAPAVSVPSAPTPSAVAVPPPQLSPVSSAAAAAAAAATASLAATTASTMTTTATTSVAPSAHSSAHPLFSSAYRSAPSAAPSPASPSTAAAAPSPSSLSSLYAARKAAPTAASAAASAAGASGSAVLVVSAAEAGLSSSSSSSSSSASASGDGEGSASGGSGIPFATSSSSSFATSASSTPPLAASSSSGSSGSSGSSSSSSAVSFSSSSTAATVAPTTSTPGFTAAEDDTPVARGLYAGGNLSVSMYGTQEQVTDGKSFTEYLLQCAWRRGDVVVQWIVGHRYSEFEELHASLRTKLEGQSDFGVSFFSKLPKLPGKSLFASGTSPAVVEERRRGLTTYLRDIFDRYPKAIALPEMDGFLRLTVRLASAVERFSAEGLGAASGGGSGGGLGPDGSGRGGGRGGGPVVIDVGRDSPSLAPRSAPAPLSERELAEVESQVGQLRGMLRSYDVTVMDPRADPTLQALVQRLEGSQLRIHVSVEAAQHAIEGGSSSSSSSGGGGGVGGGGYPVALLPRVSQAEEDVSSLLSQYLSLVTVRGVVESGRGGVGGGSGLSTAGTSGFRGPGGFSAGTTRRY